MEDQKMESIFKNVKDTAGTALVRIGAKIAQIGGKLTKTTSPEGAHSTQKDNVNTNSGSSTKAHGANADGTQLADVVIRHIVINHDVINKDLIISQSFRKEIETVIEKSLGGK